MDAYIAKNKSGWILHEYISIQEEQISEYPNVTGSYAIVKVGDRYLIGYNDWRKQWEFPAGGIENGETARQAAYRELLEETHQGNLELEFKELYDIKHQQVTAQIKLENLEKNLKAAKEELSEKDKKIVQLETQLKHK